MDHFRKKDLLALFPQLQSERLTLRKVMEEDQDELYKLLNDPLVRRYNTFRPETSRFPERLIRYFKDSYRTLSSLHFAVVLNEGEQFAGLCSFQRWKEEEGSASMGYMILPELWNRGIATEAAERLLEFGFTELGLKLVYAACDPDNHPSQSVLAKCGFKPADEGENQSPYQKRYALTMADLQDAKLRRLLHK